MTPKEKIEKAIEIIKSIGISGLGKCRAYANGNSVEIFTEDGYYCTVNVKSRAVRGI